ncbi:MAG TPA: helix-turn-helix domain-containing protein [Terriglobales bacterium]|nr:helix-turn-helix domain-containing protein [Terriglobales bacterium]
MSNVQKKPPQNTIEHDASFEPLLDSDEAAALLKIHPKTLQRMARNGEVPGIQIGKLWRFRASELNAWMQGIIAHSYPCRLNLERRQA